MRGYGTEVLIPQLPPARQHTALINPVRVSLLAGEELVIDPDRRPYTHIWVCVYSGTLDLSFGRGSNSRSQPHARWGITAKPEPLKVAPCSHPLTVFAANSENLSGSVVLTDHGLGEYPYELFCRVEALMDRICECQEQLTQVFSNVGRFK
jgi:hypothetical protein